MLKARILPLGVLPYDAKIDIVMAGLITRDVLDQDDGRVDVQLLSQGYVERLMTGTFDWSVENA